MKKLLLFVFILCVGMSSVAIAQESLCKTLKDCDALIGFYERAYGPDSETPDKGLHKLLIFGAHVKIEKLLGIKWTEIDGLKWSNVLLYRYDNLDYGGTKPINGIIQKSQATEVCRLIGGRLPANEDFETSLGEYWGIEMQSQNFWSSQVSRKDTRDTEEDMSEAHHFVGSRPAGDIYSKGPGGILNFEAATPGRLVGGFSRFGELAVRCVTDS